VIEFKDKAIQDEYDDLQAEAYDLEEQLKATEQRIKQIEDTAERE
jgi:hypothetical protein